MTESSEVAINGRRAVRKRRCCFIATAVILLHILIILILAFTVFKVKKPKTKLVSITVDGISPNISLPDGKINLNISLNMEILIYNPNHASFKHGIGKALVFYKGSEFGDVDVYPGRIPSTGSETIRCRVILEADEIGSNMDSLTKDILGGELDIEARITIPGKVTLLGIIRKHIVIISNCQIAIQLSDLSILRQDCKNKVKL